MYRDIEWEKGKNRLGAESVALPYIEHVAVADRAVLSLAEVHEHMPTAIAFEVAPVDAAFNPGGNLFLVSRRHVHVGNVVIEVVKMFLKEKMHI